MHFISTREYLRAFVFFFIFFQTLSCCLFFNNLPNYPVLYRIRLFNLKQKYLVLCIFSYYQTSGALSFQLFDKPSGALSFQFFNKPSIVLSIQLFNKPSIILSIQLFNKPSIILSIQLFNKPSGAFLFNKPSGALSIQLFNKPSGALSFQLFNKPSGALSIQLFNKPSVVLSFSYSTNNPLLWFFQLFNKPCGALSIQLLVPYRWNRGDFRFPHRLSVSLSVRMSLRPSVRLSLSPLGVRPLSFPNFSQSSFEILTWNLVYDFILTWFRLSSTFVAFDFLLLELLPFAKIQFSWFFSVVLWDIDFKFGIRLCLYMIQIKFDFCCVFHIWICLGLVQVKCDFCRVWPTFYWVIAFSKL